MEKSVRVQVPLSTVIKQKSGVASELSEAFLLGDNLSIQITLLNNWVALYGAAMLLSHLA